MSDQQASVTTDDRSDEPRIPYERYQAAVERGKNAEKQLQELQAWREEFENRDKSESEKERVKREEAERRAQEAESRLVSMERSGWIRAEASRSGFDDPDDAVAFINAGQIESPEEAARAVKDLAKRKPRLLREAPQTPPIGQVVANGQPVQAGGQQQQELDPAGVALLKQLEAAQATGWTSVPATE